MAKTGSLYGVGLGIMLITFVSSSFSTAASDTNVTAIYDLQTAGFVTGLGVFGLAVLLDILGYVTPKFKELKKAFSQ